MGGTFNELIPSTKTQGKGSVSWYTLGHTKDTWLLMFKQFFTQQELNAANLVQKVVM